MTLDIQRYFDQRETQYLTHSFHPYPNKFVPQIARAAIEEFSKESDLILDPFCGSGTTLIEANMLKRNSIGVDLNPLACLISRVKVTPLETAGLKTAVKGLLENLYRNLKQKDKLDDFVGIISPEIPEFPNREYWFQEDALIGLGTLKALVNEIEEEKIKNFCLVAMSSIVKDVSNASSLYHLTKLRNPKRIGKLDVFRRFERKILAMIEAMGDYNNKVNSNSTEVHCEDARNLGNLDGIDCVITNPPIFFFDFIRCFKIFFWWLELGNILELDKKMIGTSRVNGSIRSLGIDFVDELASSIEEEDMSAAVALSKYYLDMKGIFDEIYRLLKDDGYCCLRASDSKLHGNTIRCPDVFCELAEQAGFRMVNRIERVVPKKSTIFVNSDKVEEFLIFKK